MNWSLLLPFLEVCAQLPVLLAEIGGLLAKLTDCKERLRLLLDLNTAGVGLHSVELGRGIDLDDEWELVQQSIQATTDDVEKRTEIERSKRETQRRVDASSYQGHPPLGTRFDAAGDGLIPDPNEWPTIMDAFELLDDGESYRSINKVTDLSLATISPSSVPI